MASSVLAARAALHAALVALQATTLDGVKILRTGTWQEIPNHELIVVGMPSGGEREPRRLGQLSYDETYTIPVHIQTAKSRGNIDTVEERLWELVGIVEQAVLDDPRLGDTVIRALPGDWTDGDISANDTFVENHLTLNIDVLNHVDLGTP